MCESFVYRVLGASRAGSALNLGLRYGDRSRVSGDGTHCLYGCDYGCGMLQTHYVLVFPTKSGAICENNDQSIQQHCSLCGCVCRCVCVGVYVGVYVWVGVYVCVGVCGCGFMCMFVWVYAGVFECMYGMGMCVWVYVGVSGCVCACVCVWVCVCVCVGVCKVCV